MGNDLHGRYNFTNQQKRTIESNNSLFNADIKDRVIDFEGKKKEMRR